VELLSPIRPHFIAIANHRGRKSKAAAAELVEVALLLSPIPFHISISLNYSI
jgi:hypothetical protein